MELTRSTDDAKGDLYGRNAWWALALLVRSLRGGTYWQRDVRNAMVDDDVLLISPDGVKKAVYDSNSFIPYHLVVSLRAFFFLV